MKAQIALTGFTPGSRWTLKLCVALGMVAATTQAAVVQLTFEGLKNQEQVADYYNGKSGGGQYDETGAKYATGGSTGGTNYGISFGGNSLAIVAEDAGGTGRFANNPSGSTVLSFNDQIKSNSYMNVAGGFTTGIAFWYSQPFYPITVKIYDGLNATGKLLATMNLPQSPNNCPVDKKNNSLANCWAPVGATFQGVAHSVDFSGANFSAFDNFTIGDSVTVPIPPLAPPVSTCPIQYGIKSFVLEHKLDAFSFTSAFIPSFSPSQLAVFFDPTKEIHTHFEFSTSDMVVRAWSYALAVGGPAMAPPGLDFKSNAIAFAVIPIDRVYTTCVPRPAIAITGYVGDSTPVYGSMVGLPHWIGFSFDPSITSNINNALNITTVNAGTTTILGTDGSVVVVPAVQNNPGPSTTTGPSIVLVPAPPSGGALFQVFNNPFSIDASTSTPAVAKNGPLTFAWSSDKPANFSPSNTSANPSIYFQSGRADYTITCIVTDAAGISSKASFVVSYLGNR